MSHPLCLIIYVSSFMSHHLCLIIYVSFLLLSYNSHIISQYHIFPPLRYERTVSTVPLTSEDSSEDSGSDSTEEDGEESEEGEEDSEEEEEEQEEGISEQGDQTDENGDDIPRPQKSGEAISLSHRVQLRALVSELIRTKANHPVAIFATGIVVRF
jgi:hypothetical protein